MPTLFGRSKHPDSMYDDSIDAWLASSSQDDPANATNLMFDSRVSPARERAVDKFVKEKGDLCDGLRAYFKKRIGAAKNPHFVYRSINKENLVRHRQISNPKIGDDTLLARVLVLNGLRPVYTWAKTNGWSGQLIGFDPGFTDKRLAKWIREETSISTRNFVANTLQMMDAHRKRRSAHQPIWATLWKGHLEEHVRNGSGARDWLNIVGKGRKSYDQWCILLAYPAKLAPTLARPTVLDSDLYPYHIPSPDWAPTDHGGYALDMDTTRLPIPLLPEFIHNETAHILEHWEAAGARLERATAYTTAEVNAEDIGSARLRHRDQLLKPKYGAKKVDDWLPAVG